MPWTLAITAWLAGCIASPGVPIELESADAEEEAGLLRDARREAGPGDAASGDAALGDASMPEQSLPDDAASTNLPSGGSEAVVLDLGLRQPADVAIDASTFAPDPDGPQGWTVTYFQPAGGQTVVASVISPGPLAPASQTVLSPGPEVNVELVAVAPDSRFLLVMMDDDLHRVDLVADANGVLPEPVFLTDDFSPWTQFAISPDSTRLAYLRVSYALMVLDLVGGTPAEVQADKIDSAFSPVWLPDSSAVVYWNLQDDRVEAGLPGQPVRVLPIPDTRPLELSAALPDGRILLNWFQGAWSTRFDAAAPTRLTPDGVDDWSPWPVFVAADRLVLHRVDLGLYSVALDGHDAESPVALDGSAFCEAVAISPDGRRLACSLVPGRALDGPTLVEFDIATGVQRTLPDEDAAATAGMAYVDDLNLVTCSTDGLAHIDLAPDQVPTSSWLVGPEPQSGCEPTNFGSSVVVVRVRGDGLIIYRHRDGERGARYRGVTLAGGAPVAVGPTHSAKSMLGEDAVVWLDSDRTSTLIRRKLPGGAPVVLGEPLPGTPDSIIPQEDSQRVLLQTNSPSGTRFFMVDRDDGAAHRVPMPEGDPWIDASAQGGWLTAFKPEGFDVFDSTIAPLTEDAGEIRSVPWTYWPLVFASDRLFYTDRWEVYFTELGDAGSTPVHLLSGLDEDPASLALDPATGAVLTLRSDHALVAFDPADPEAPPRELVDGALSTQWFDVVPGGGRVLLMGPAGIHSTSTAAAQARAVRLTAGRAWPHEISPDGRWALLGFDRGPGWDQTLLRTDGSDAETPRTVLLGDGRVYSSDGTAMAWPTETGLAVFDLDLDVAPRLIGPDDGLAVGPPLALPGGGFAYSVGHEARVVERTGHGTWEVIATAPTLNGGRVLAEPSPDGRALIQPFNWTTPGELALVPLNGRAPPIPLAEPGVVVLFAGYADDPDNQAPPAPPER